MKLTPVTDPALLQQLDGPAAAPSTPALRPVTDPALLAQLESSGGVVDSVRQDLADVYHGGRAAWGKVLNAVLPDYSPHKKDAAEMMADEEKVQNKLLGAVLPTVATAPLGGGLFKGGAAVVEGLLPKAATELGALVGKSAARVGGGATAGAGIGALNTVGTDESALQGAGVGALIGGGAQLPFELLPGAATLLKSGRNAVLDKLKARVPGAPDVDPQVAAAAEARGFTPHSGKVETPEEVAARDLANQNQLGSQLSGLVSDVGGPLSQEAAATQVGERFRPALERFGREAGKGFDALYAGKRIKLNDAEFHADVRRAINNERSLPEPAQDKQFIKTAESLIAGEVPNPAYEQILDQLGGNEARALQVAKQAGVAPTLPTQQLQGYDVATGTVPIDVTRAAITKFGRLAEQSSGAEKRLGYGALQQALKSAQERSLSPKDYERLQELRGQYRYFKQQEDATPDKNTNLLRLIQNGDTETMNALRNILDDSDFAAVERAVGQRMMTELQNTAQGGRPSVTALQPQTVERAIAAVPPEAARQFLPERSLSELGRISGELLAPQENLLLRPQGSLGKLVDKLMGGAGGAVGAGAGSVLGGHPIVGYGVGKALSQDKGTELIRKLLNTPTPALTETLPFFTRNPQISQSITRLLLQGAQ